MGTVGLMREEERKEMTGLSRVQWWRLEREGGTASSIAGEKLGRLVAP